VRNRTLLGLIMLLTGISGGAQQAEAGLRFCNQSTMNFKTAVGYVDRQKGWVARGWLSIDPGQCKDALQFPLDNRYYYYYAIGRSSDNARVRYTGENSFCIESRKFSIYQSDYGKSAPDDCARDGLRSEKFKKIDVQGKPEFTVNLGGPDNPPTEGGDPTAGPGRPPVAVVPPPAAQPQPAPAVAVQPPVVQQPQGPAVRPPAQAAEEEEPAPPPRRRARQQQPGPDTPPAPPTAQGGGANGTACQRFPNLC
jgi:uncharacterized membrane protein